MTVCIILECTLESYSDLTESSHLDLTRRTMYRYDTTEMTNNTNGIDIT